MSAHRMSWVQRLAVGSTPPGQTSAIEAESRAWIARCANCGAERSVWELGGIRAGAAGSPRWRIRCASCGAKAWHQLRRTGEAAGAPPVATTGLAARIVAIVLAAVLVTAGATVLALWLAGVI